MPDAKNQDHLLYCSREELFKPIAQESSQLKFNTKLAPDEEFCTPALLQYMITGVGSKT